MRSIVAAAVLLVSSSAQAQVREVIERRLPRMKVDLRESVIRAIETSKDPPLILSMIQSESGYNPKAESSVGAKGLLQVIPDTFRRESQTIGLRRARIGHPPDDVRVGISYVERMIDMFGSTRRGLMAYAWGPGKLAAAKRVPASVREYARKILARRDEIIGRAARLTCMQVGTAPVCWGKPMCAVSM